MKIVYLIGLVVTFIYAYLTVERDRYYSLDWLVCLIAALFVAVIWPISLPGRLLGYPYAAWQRRKEGK